MNVYVKGNGLRISAKNTIGKGGEADIYALPGDVALKVFKQPDHPDLQGQPQEQKAAEERLRLHQRKLPCFPKNLPERVATPTDLATNRAGTTILGYTMPLRKETEVLARYSDPGYRQAGDPVETGRQIRDIFLDLHGTLSSLHRQQVTIGDFNDLNVLVQPGQPEAWLVDADSFQFGPFPCQVFTLKFTDPLLCSAGKAGFVLTAPFNFDSDWYAYHVMLMESLLCVHPFGGVYRPKDRSKRIPQMLRPLRRISVFDPEVRYPRAALPFETLPDELLQHFVSVFTKDLRAPLSTKLLERVEWQSCSQCGTPFARRRCPTCHQVAPAAKRRVLTKQGQVLCEMLHQCQGRIAAASNDNNHLRWLVLEGDRLKRDTGATLIRGRLPLQARVLQQKETSHVAVGHRLASLVPHAELSEQRQVDTCAGVPQVACNRDHLFWLEGGTLYRSGEMAPAPWGRVLQNQTRIWVGDTFGFGFYRAGDFCVGFVFETKRRGIQDRVALPRLHGQLIDARCVLSESYGWFFCHLRDQGKHVSRCTVVRADGHVEAHLVEIESETPWLVHQRGQYATGNRLFVPTDEGIVRVTLHDGAIEESCTFPDTEPFVHSGCQLLPDPQGFIVHDKNRLFRLKLL